MFSTRSSDTNKIEKLNGYNYNIWKGRVPYILIQDKTYYVITSAFQIKNK